MPFKSTTARWLLLVMIAGLWAPAAVAMDSEASAGRFVAEGWQPELDDPLTLRGQWQVVWGKLVAPEDFDAHYQGEYFYVPGRWNDLDRPGVEGSSGLATFRLKVEILPFQGELSLHQISPHSAWRMFVNGELVGRNGDPRPQTFQPHYVSRMMNTRSTSTTLVLQVSNQGHAYGGPGHAPVLWVRDQLQAFLDGLSLYYVFVMAVLGTLAILHLTVFASGRAGQRYRRAHLWLAVLCLVLVYRVGGVIPYLYLQFGDAALYGDLKGPYVSLYLAPAAYLLFFRSVFPQFISRVSLRVGLLAFLVPMGVTIFASEHVFTSMRNYAIFANLTVILVTTVVALWAVRRSEPGALTVFITNLLFFATALNDGFVYTDQGNGVDLTPIGILLLGVGYSFALRQRLQKTLLEADQAFADLEKLNRELELEVEERTSAFKSAAARAENSADQQARFIAAASHDFRQPLHALSLFTATLKRKVDSSTHTKLIERQETSIKNLSDLLQDTLDSSRMEAGQTSPEFARVQIRSLVDSLLEDYQPKADMLGVTVNVSINQAELVTDAMMLRRILANVLDNALKAASREVRLRVVKTEEARFEIEDDGVGMSDEDFERVFRPYVSLASSQTSEPNAQEVVGGYGLGLFVVRQFSEILGGRVDITRSDLGGMRFVVTLPDGKYLPPCTVDTDPLSFEVDLSGKRILAVDDEPEVGAAIVGLLETYGASVKFASDSAQAITVMEEEFKPHLVLLDYHLREGTGLALLKDMQSRFGETLQAIFVTGATEDQIIDGIERSGHEVLTKPIDEQQLLAKLASRFG